MDTSLSSVMWLRQRVSDLVEDAFVNNEVIAGLEDRQVVADSGHS